MLTTDSSQALGDGPNAFAPSAQAAAHAFILKNFELEGLSLDDAAQKTALDILAHPAADAKTRLKWETDCLARIESRFALPLEARRPKGAESDFTTPAGPLADEPRAHSVGEPSWSALNSPSVDRYAQPNGVLKNKFGADSQFFLDQAEAAVASASLACLLRAEIEGEFQGAWSFDCLRGIHRAIFGRVYDWAGNPRTIDIEKNGMGYARHERIQEAARRFFSKQATGTWTGLSPENAAHALAFLLGEIYAIHPFREGNSRSSRTHVRLIAKRLGFELGFKGLGRDEWMLAVGQHFNGDPTLLRAVFSRCLEPLPAERPGKSVAVQAAGRPEALTASKSSVDPFAGILPPMKRRKRKFAHSTRETPSAPAD